MSTFANLKKRWKADKTLRDRVNLLMPEPKEGSFFAKCEPARKLQRRMIALDLTKYGPQTAFDGPIMDVLPLEGTREPFTTYNPHTAEHPISTYPLRAKVIKDATQTSEELNTLHPFMIRLLNFAMDAIYVIEHDETRSSAAQRKIQGICAFTDEFLQRLDDLGDGPLDNKKAKKAAQIVKDFASCVGDVLLPNTTPQKLDNDRPRWKRLFLGSKVEQTRTKALKTADADTNSEMSRYIQESVSYFTPETGPNAGKKFRLIIKTTPICSITEEQKAELIAVVEGRIHYVWYDTLPEWRKLSLTNKVRQAVADERAGRQDAWAFAAQTPSPTDGILPLTRNLCLHEFVISEETREGYKDLCKGSRYGYGIPSSIRNRSNHEDRIRHCRQNLEQILMVAGVKKIQAQDDAKSEFHLSDELLKEFMEHWQLRKVTPDEKGAALEDGSEPKEEELKYVFPITSDALITPSDFYETDATEKLSDNHNDKWWQDKHDKVQEIQSKFKPLQQRLQARDQKDQKVFKVNFETKILDFDFALNGLRGRVSDRVKQHNRHLINSLFVDGTNNLVTLAKLKGVDPQLFLDLNNLINQAHTEDAKRSATVYLKAEERYNRLFKNPHVAAIGAKIDEILAKPEIAKALVGDTDLRQNEFRLHLHTLKKFTNLFYNWRFGNKRNRQSFFASYASTYIDTMKGVCGEHCRSGRDRFAYAMMMSICQAMNFHVYGELSDYGARWNKRAKFEKFFPLAYDHFADQAAQSSRGCRGIKDEGTPWPASWGSRSLFATTLFPSGIGKRLGSIFKTSKILAKINKPTLGVWGDSDLWAFYEKLSLASIFIIGLGFAVTFFLFPLPMLTSDIVPLALSGICGLIGALAAKAFEKPILKYTAIGALIGGLLLPVLLPWLSVTAMITIGSSLIIGLSGGKISSLSGGSPGVGFLIGAVVGIVIPLVLAFTVPGLGSSLGDLTSGLHGAISTAISFLQDHFSASYEFINYTGLALGLTTLATTIWAAFPTIHRTRTLQADKDRLLELIENPHKGKQTDSTTSILQITGGKSEMTTPAPQSKFSYVSTFSSPKRLGYSPVPQIDPDSAPEDAHSAVTTYAPESAALEL